MPSGQVVTLACTLGQTLLQLKDHFSQELKMSMNLILLMFDGNIFIVLFANTILMNLYFDITWKLTSVQDSIILL